MNEHGETLRKNIVIEGITAGGQVFRPSDWAERLCGDLSTFRRRRIAYSPLLYPAIKNGYKCIVLTSELETAHPELYQAILEFAQANQLKIAEEDSDN